MEMVQQRVQLRAHELNQLRHLPLALPCSAFCGLCIVYSYFFVYETKGLGLEEVDNLFLTSTAPTSAARNRQMKAARYQDTEGGVGGEIQHTHEATIANDHSDVDIKSPEGKE